MTQRTQLVRVVVLAVFMAALVSGAGGLKNAALAQSQPIIYPAKGQSQDQMEQDKYGCYTWAKGQTGFDPMQAGLASQPPPQSQGSASPLKGAAGGAAVGAVGGAIAGDAGKGAAIGAASGAMIGGMRKRGQAQQQASAQQQQQAAVSSKQAEYNRAFGACMEGRGYTVK
jgi:Glycine-zipper domain